MKMFYVIKILDIIYITIIYFFLSFFLSIYINKILDKYDNNDNIKEEKTIILFIKTMIIVSLYVLIIYILRNMVEFIPSPFNNLYGFHHHKLKELSGSLVFGYMFFTFQYNTLQKLEYLNKYISKHNYLSIYKIE